MGQQVSNNEINSLFESLKERLSKYSTLKTILFWFFILLSGVMIILEVMHHTSITAQSILSVLFFVCAIIGVLNMNWYNKIANADNAQSLLTAYDKYKKGDTWLTIIFVIALVFILISIFKFHSNYMIVILTTLPIIFRIRKKDNTEIEQLRNLMNKS